MTLLMIRVLSAGRKPLSLAAGKLHRTVETIIHEKRYLADNANLGISSTIKRKAIHMALESAI
uniref:Uncharacterized protein n=1 Tax=Candidatus Kentrum sp. LFY TaxID=2126342 RepID=A0A450U621_9GAMM|nr:MAG: hypothetical protein BECKLFY1418B_GA0070995_100482 [Candidatus Kentron sp. LFY]